MMAWSSQRERVRERERESLLSVESHSACRIELSFFFEVLLMVYGL